MIQVRPFHERPRGILVADASPQADIQHHLADRALVSIWHAASDQVSIRANPCRRGEEVGKVPGHLPLLTSDWPAVIVQCRNHLGACSAALRYPKMRSPAFLRNDPRIILQPVVDVRPVVHVAIVRGLIRGASGPSNTMIVSSQSLTGAKP